MKNNKMAKICLLSLLPSISLLASENYITDPATSLRGKSDSAAPARLQQNGKTITGVVQDALGPIAGANIIVKGTTNGNITDMDGKFTLENVPANATLVISYIGFTPQEIRVGNQTTFNITLQEDSEALDEVIVVGYGVMKKKDLTGAVAQLNSGSMKDLKVSHPTEAMAGKLAGVQVQQVGGQPGQAAINRVRRVRLYHASSAPLYVVDGYPLGEQNPECDQPERYRIHRSIERCFGSRHLRFACSQRRRIGHNQVGKDRQGQRELGYLCRFPERNKEDGPDERTGICRIQPGSLQ